MKPERLRRIETLYQAAHRQVENRRDAFLKDACGEDEELRREVESLLRREDQAHDFMELPVLKTAVQRAVSRESGSKIGSQIGPYRIVSLLGAGGMGEVYRAEDTSLGRDVAIKTLPQVLARDAERVARFKREAQILASLNHSKIATIYGLVECDGCHYIVEELVEGQNLAEILSKGRTGGNRSSGRSLMSRPSRNRLSLKEVLRLGIQIAEALEAAHEKAIIHRDLKPANVMVSEDGRLKLLDFGLAKTVEVAIQEVDQSEDMTTGLFRTEEGQILGTPAYMSPEQVRGGRVDKRTDIWSFGALLYELLTGKSAFGRETMPETIAAVLGEEPDWKVFPSGVSESLRRLTERCLQKDPNYRLRDIGDARIEMEALQASREQTLMPRILAGTRRSLAWSLGLALVAGAVGLWTVRRKAPDAEARLEINTPPTQDLSLAISPDGRKIVFVVRLAGSSQLWMRSLDSLTSKPLPGTETASQPFWSPDSRFLGFFSSAGLRRLEIETGTVKTLAPLVPAPQGGSWSPDGGAIIYSISPNTPIFRVSSEGGEPTAVTSFESSAQKGHLFPQFLPDGRHFLFFATGGPEVRGVYAGRIDGAEIKRLISADAPAVYTSGHLLFIRQDTLWAQRFDPDRLALSQDPFPMAQPVPPRTRIFASASGTIAYRSSSPDVGRHQVVWKDRSGLEKEGVSYPDTSAFTPSVSPDGRRFAVVREVDGNRDIWSYEWGRGLWDRLTFDASDDIFPVWSPIGGSIAFGSRRGRLDRMDLYLKILRAPPGNDKLLLSTPQIKFPMDWSPDGQLLLYNILDPKRGFDIWALPLPEGDPFPLVETDFNERAPQLSPDGKMLAYESDRTGRFEIYARPFPGPGTEVTVSAEGGTQARWNPAGGELFYLAPDERLMAVPISFDGEAMATGPPLALFATNAAISISSYRQTYAVSRDGQSFLINSALAQAHASPITIILNWTGRQE